MLRRQTRLQALWNYLGIVRPSNPIRFLIRGQTTLLFLIQAMFVQLFHEEHLAFCYALTARF